MGEFFVNTYYFSVSKLTTFIQGHTKFPKNQEPAPGFGCQNGYMKHAPYRGATVLEQPVNLARIWQFLHGTFELICIFVCKQKNIAIITLKALGAQVLYIPVFYVFSKTLTIWNSDACWEWC